MKACVCFGDCVLSCLVIHLPASGMSSCFTYTFPIPHIIIFSLYLPTHPQIICCRMLEGMGKVWGAYLRSAFPTVILIIITVTVCILPYTRTFPAPPNTTSNFLLEHAECMGEQRSDYLFFSSFCLQSSLLLLMPSFSSLLFHYIIQHHLTSPAGHC